MSGNFLSGTLVEVDTVACWTFAFNCECVVFVCRNGESVFFNLEFCHDV